MIKHSFYNSLSLKSKFNQQCDSEDNSVFKPISHSQIMPEVALIQVILGVILFWNKMQVVAIKEQV